jgi:hypothetical protein
MTLPRSAADVLKEHVTMQLECVDRMYLNVYQPKLAFAEGIVHFFRAHRGQPIASSALMGPITNDFVDSIHRFIAASGIDLVHFKKGERKDDLAHEHLERHDGSEGILFVGRAQEKANVFRTERRRNPLTGRTYPWLVADTAMVNHFYFYGFDDDFGPFFIKFATYFPYVAKCCINGHEWAKRQAQKAGLDFEALDNGFARCSDPARLQRICASLSAHKIERFVRKWLARLPHAYSSADRQAGYRYDISILQAEFSLTQVLDRPHSGRVFFESVIRDNLDLGRPDRVSLIFDRRIIARGKRPTPGQFVTRVLTEGVTPSLHVYYRSSKIKQYHKEGAALRTETTINDAPGDFNIGKRLHNLAALAKVGFSANRRLLDVQRISQEPWAGEEAVESLSHPVEIAAQRAPGLRFGDRRVHALMSTLMDFRLLPRGFSNRDLRARLHDLLGRDFSPGSVTYDLRRLRLRGLIERVPHSNRYQVTDTGVRTAALYSRTHQRILVPAMADLVRPIGSGRISRALRQLDQALDAA